METFVILLSVYLTALLLYVLISYALTRRNCKVGRHVLDDSCKCFYCKAYYHEYVEDDKVLDLKCESCGIVELHKHQYVYNCVLDREECKSCGAINYSHSHSDRLLPAPTYSVGSKREMAHAHSSSNPNNINAVVTGSTTIS